MVRRAKSASSGRSPRSAARKSSASTGAKTATSASAAARSMKGVADMFAKFPVSDVAGKLIEGRRRDLDAIIEANRKSYQGIQAVVERQTAMLKDSIAQWQSVAKMMAASGPRESISKLDELAKQSFGMAVANIRELAELAARSQADAFEVVRQRIRENVEEVTRLLNRN